MKHDIIAKYGQWITAGAILTFGLGIWARVLRGPALWQEVVLLISALIFTTYYLALVTNWGGITERHVKQEQLRTEHAEHAPMRTAKRLKQVRLRSLLGLSGGLLMLLGTVIQLAERFIQ